jgi:tyrosinase
MKISSLFAVGLAAGVGAAPLEPSSAYKSDDIMDLGIQNLKHYYAKHQYSNTKCTLKNAAVRREWYNKLWSFEDNLTNYIAGQH